MNKKLNLDMSCFMAVLALFIVILTFYGQRIGFPISIGFLGTIAATLSISYAGIEFRPKLLIIIFIHIGFAIMSLIILALGHNKELFHKFCYAGEIFTLLILFIGLFIARRKYLAKKYSKFPSI